MAKLSFLGATDGVTGSAYAIETDSANILLECGLIQGRAEQESANSQPFPFNVDDLDAVVISHAHLDHSGRLPKLVADGYRGPIYMTLATLELLEIMLKDAAFLQQRDTAWENKWRQRAGEDELEPLYTLEDVEETLALCVGVPYGRSTRVVEGFEVCYRDAGHILGSAIVEMTVTEAGKSTRLVFSGDLGNSSAALLKDPEKVHQADVLILESTYGDRDHRPMNETLLEFEQVISDASKNGGNILIPAFAVGRTQEIIFRLGELYQKGALRQQAVYLDSPMAIATTEVYHRHQDSFNRHDGTALGQGTSGTLHTFLPVLRYTRSTAESMALNKVSSGAIIIAGSGMCNGGRIRHHFKHNLWRNKAHVIIVGFQAYGTPGRALVDGAQTFRIGKEEVKVRAKIHTLGGFSAHAGQSQLLQWVEEFTEKKPRIHLVHGEDGAKAALCDKLSQRGWKVDIPQHGQTITL